MKRAGFVLLFLVYLLAMFLGSCRAKKSVQVETKKKDSIYYRVETVKAPVLSDVLTIQDICKDSVATEFKRIFVQDTDTVYIESRDNTLTVTLRQKEKTISELEKRLELRESEVKELRNTVKVRTDWRLVLILSGVILLFVMFPKIPYFLNKAIRQFL